MATAFGCRWACQLSAEATLVKSSLFQVGSTGWSMSRIFLDSDEISDRFNQCRSAVFQYVVAAIRQAVDDRLREVFQPRVEERRIEHEILFSPRDQAGSVRQQV